jgi:hypothetical protein
MVMLGFLSQGDAAAQVTVAAGASCLGPPASRSTEVRCAQVAAAGRLQPHPQLHHGPTTSAGSVGTGALVGLGVGAGVGILAALVVAQGCEENESRCTVAFILGGSALGAGIGAAVGAVVGKD